MKPELGGRRAYPCLQFANVATAGLQKTTCHSNGTIGPNTRNYILIGNAFRMTLSRWSLVTFSHLREWNRKEKKGKKNGRDKRMEKKERWNYIWRYCALQNNQGCLFPRVKRISSKSIRREVNEARFILFTPVIKLNFPIEMRMPRSPVGLSTKTQSSERVWECLAETFRECIVLKKFRSFIETNGLSCKFT